jgi:RimJ/RimL family protein N-acetyltransferase
MAATSHGGGPPEGERVRLRLIDSQLAATMIAGSAGPDLPWERGFPMAPVLGLARIVVAASEPPGPFFAYVIVRRADGLAIGDAGFHGPPTESGEVEIGYALVPAARGAGYAQEAVALLIAWAWRQPGVRLITARVEPDNAASKRVLQRLGFEWGGDRDGMERFVLEPIPR